MGLPSVGVLTTLLVVGVPAYFWVKTAGRAWMMRTFTAQPDLRALGKPRDRPKVKGTAVVCGGSFAGLFSVSVLAEHFERVVIIEPESFVFTEEARTPATSYPSRDIVDGPTGTPMRALAHKRTRVAQYDIFHVYQALTTRFLRAVFPKFDQRAAESDVQVVSTDHGLHFGGRRHKTPMKKLRTRDNEVIFKHRRGMETFVRGLVAEKFNPKGLDGSNGTGHVEFIKGTATAFNLDSTGKTITSVSYRDADGQTVNIDSALVLDCTGNTQAGLKLVSRALQLPNLTEEIRVEFNPKMNYCSFEVPLPADFHERVDKLGITETDSQLPRPSRSDGFWMGWVPTPEVDNRTFLVANQGTDRGDLTVGGWDTDLPLTWDSAVEFVRGIDKPHAPPAWILDVIDIMGTRKEEALVSLVRFKASSRIFYENKADILPTNFIAHGDSLMRVNPRRGEGTTKSCLGAVTLNALLHEQDPSNPSFGATFFSRLSTRTGPLWDAAKWLDYGRESTVPCKGETREVGKLFRWYHRNLELVMAKHEYPAEMFWRILNWDAPTFDVMTPTIIFQVCKVSLLGEKWA